MDSAVTAKKTVLRFNSEQQRDNFYKVAKAKDISVNKFLNLLINRAIASNKHLLNQPQTEF